MCRQRQTALTVAKNIRPARSDSEQENENENQDKDRASLKRRWIIMLGATGEILLRRNQLTFPHN